MILPKDGGSWYVFPLCFIPASVFSSVCDVCESWCCSFVKRVVPLWTKTFMLRLPNTQILKTNKVFHLWIIKLRGFLEALKCGYVLLRPQIGLLVVMADKWRIIETQPFRRQPFVLLGITACPKNNENNPQGMVLCVWSFTVKCDAVSTCE